jgi:hypothetical protein
MTSKTTKSKKDQKQIIEEAAKRFRTLYEFHYAVNEDEGEEAPAEDQGAMGGDPGAMGGVPNAMGGGPGAMGGDPGAMGGDPNAMGGDPNAMGGDPNAMGGDPNAMGGDPNMAGGAPGFNPQPDAGMEGDPNAMGGDPGAMTDNMQPGDEVIDVDELTKSQEETEEKVEDINVSMEKGFEKILNVVDKLNDMINASNSNMEELKRELEKRNPTPIEKLNLRAANDSYPFSVSPKDYWAEKEATSNYRVGGDDENVPEQYTITQGDIDNITDFRRISKELEDSSFNQNLMNIFSLR